MTTRIPPGVKAVFFDAVGTLIHPMPSAGEVYAQVGRDFNSRLGADEVRRRFGAAFAEQEARDARVGHRTSESRELGRWREIVAAVLDDVPDRKGCFEALYEHFARPASWRVEAGAGRLLRGLTEGGYKVGVASNFDHRLRSVLVGLGEIPAPEHLLISSEVGWKKPSVEFFGLLCADADLTPSEILFIGDDEENDFAGAREVGMHALLFDPTGRLRFPSEDRIASLGDLFGRLP